MKKFLCALFVVIAAISSCQIDEQFNDEIVCESDKFYATIYDEGSFKTVMDEYNNIRWSAGDQLVIFKKSSLGLKYRIQDAYVGKTSGDFSKVISGSSSDDLDAGEPIEHNIAYYPYSTDVKFVEAGSDYTLKVTLPSEQGYVPDSFANGSFPMAAVSSDTDLTFKNICGGIKLNFTGTCRITSIKIEGNRNEKLSGPAAVTVYADERTPVIEMADNAMTSVTLNCGDGVQLHEKTATEFIISLPPTDFTNGFVITITDTDGGTQTLYTSNNNKVLRSSLLNMPTVNVITSVEGTQDVRIVWESPQQVVSTGGGYPRVHRLNDGRLMMTYSKSYNGYARFSEDEGVSWPETSLVKPMSKFTESNEAGDALLSVAVPDFAQLSENHPHHPNRIIFAGNYRPRSTDGKTTGLTTVHPYTISISVSDDNGKTWSDTRHIYMSDRWKENVTIGCWEPFVLELPDGTVQIYFADETPYYRLGSRWHNISVIESRDGGDTWEKVRVVAQNGACRDGMPVVAIHEDRLLLAVESTDYTGERLHPIVIQNTINDNWKVTVGKGSPYRFEPFQKSLKSEVAYSGAPYIITTDNYIVYSYQIADWWTPPTGLTASQQLAQAKQNNDSGHSTLEVQVCPKSEVKNGCFNTMRAASRPLPVDQTTGKENAIWNSLCDLGNDEILAVSQYKNKVYIVKGRITGGK